MKHFIKIPLGIIAFIIIAIPSAKAADVFSDIGNHPYKESIEFLHDRGVVQGYDNGQFRPNNPINRAEMLKIILTATRSKEKLGNPRSCFRDVGTEWFARYICYAKEKTIVKGYPNGYFRPAENVNMVEGLKMGLESFPFSSSVSTEIWYEPYTEFAHKNNIFSKYDYFPDSSMTRGEMAFLIHKLLLDKEGEEEFIGRRKNWSAGCGKNPPSHPPVNSLINGVTRDYITVIPSGYNKNTPKKLIFAFHGRTNPNAMVRTYYKVEESSRGEAIMVYPAGLPTGSSSRGWSDGGDRADNLRDYKLFDQLLEEFSSNYCIDLDEVYVVGHSLGAWFTNSLACFRGNVIRGVGSLGGGTSIGSCTGPVATMIWHNPKDNLVSYVQGLAARNQYLKQNQCSQQTKAVPPSDGKCVEYQGCYDHAPVIWCPHTIDNDHRGIYYPHNWPKITGSSIWSFFKKQ